MYAILDIETTGGKYNEEGITEIAIYKYDGQEVVDQFISLVNSILPIENGNYMDVKIEKDSIFFHIVNLRNISLVFI